jgi:chromosome segregation ATPase
MNSDVSDDDSDSPSYEELLELVHEHQKVIKKQINEIKNLSALNDLNAIFATNYENLLCKFKFLSEEHEELKLKIESINDKIVLQLLVLIQMINLTLAMRNALRMLL